MSLSHSSKIKLTLLGVGVFLILFLSGWLYINTLTENNSKGKYERYMLVSEENVYLVYEDRLAVRLPLDLHLEKGKTIGDMVKVRDFYGILKDINSIFPEKIKNYKVVKYGELDIALKNARNVPETTVNGKRYILTSSIETLFEDIYEEKLTQVSANKKIILDILNANGVSGHARRTGNLLKNKFNVKYNAANYEENINESYIIVNNLSRKEIEDIVMTINEKYLKIKEDTAIPTLANAVIVLGQEKEKIYTIKVAGSGELASTYINELNKKGYIGVEKLEKKNDKKEVEISYGREDYYVAYKIGKQLGISKFIENNSLNNEIIIIAND